jgi:predicted deacylase
LKQLNILLITIFVVIMLISCKKIDDDIIDDSKDDIIVIKSEQTFLENKADEFTVYTFETNVDGPTFFIIAGIHGDERAGWMAANELLLENFKRGTVHILPAANPLAITANPPLRTPSGRTDLNRAFPGNANGSDTEKLADALFQVISSYEPDIALDLHESRFSYVDGRIGDSIILHLSRYTLYALEVLDTFNALPLQAGLIPFTHLNAPPEGSINRVFSETYGVPVFTIETNRDAVVSGIDQERNPLDLRIQQQLTLISIFLDTFEVSNV